MRRYHLKSLNVDSLKYNAIAVEELMNNSDFVCIQEHWLWAFENEHIIKKMFPGAGFHSRAVDEFHNITPIAVSRGHGGVCTLWKREHDPYMKKTSDGNERVLITIFEPPHNARVCLINCYLPAGESKKAIEDFANDIALIEALLDKYKEYTTVIAGDLNADIYNRKGRKEQLITEMVNKRQLIVLNNAISSQPTYEHQSGNHNSHLDYFIVNKTHHWKATNVISRDVAQGQLNNSPHKAIGTSFTLEGIVKSTGKPSKPNEECRGRKVNWGKVDKNSYQEAILEEIEHIQFDKRNPEQSMAILTKVLCNAADKVNPRSHKPNGGKQRNKNLWTPAIATAVHKSKHAFWQWKQAGRPPKTHPLSQLKNSLSKKLRNEQRKEIARRRHQLLKEIMVASENDPKIFHRLIQMNRATSNTTQAILASSVLVFNEDEQRQLWAKYFGELSMTQEHENSNKDTEVVRLIHEHHIKNPERHDNYTVWDIEKAVSDLNRGKAPDLNGITAEHLQNAPIELMSILTDIINQIFDSCQVPNLCKKGFKIPIPKKGKDERLMSNHRGISITALTGKVIEKLLQAHTDNILTQKQSQLQFGFTKGLAPIMASLCLTEAIGYAKEQKQDLIVSTLDVQKAFDVVDHQKMKIKLHLESIDPRSWQLIDRLYSQLSETVQWKGNLSEPFSITKGVRQGAILSTSLYKMYINDLLIDLEKASTGMHIGSIYIGTPTCADDQLLIANNAQDMQAMLNAVHEYSNEHLYKIHPSKSSITNMAKAQNEALTYHLGDDIIPEASSFIHLGLEWRANKTGPDIHGKIAQARKASYALIGAGMHGGNGLSPAVSRKIIDTYIVPRLLYGLEAVVLSNSEVEELSSYHRSLLRQIQSLPKYTAVEAVYLLLGTLPLEAEIHIRVLNLYGAICRSENTTMKELASRQLSMGSPYSWFNYVQQICQKYNITTEASLTAPWYKKSWKNYIQLTIRGFWIKDLLLRKASKSSLSLLLVATPSKGTTHPVWESCIRNPRCVNAAITRARLITGTYGTMKQNSKMDRTPGKDTCALCYEETEDIPHLLLRCKALEICRNDGLDLLAREGFTVNGSDANAAMLLLNGPTKSSSDMRNNNYYKIQGLINSLCHRLHTQRLNKISTSSIHRVKNKKSSKNKRGGRVCSNNMK